ncbi:MAG: hypothetical protein KGZ34_03545 [Nitrosarchaeum sp.]|nr:hypothetical protein [Nitrosarchaeum sp.]
MELRTSDQWMNMVFSLPCWRGQGKFKTMCKNIKKYVEHDFYFEGNQPNTQAYDIIWILMKKYYTVESKPMNQKELRKSLGMRTGTRNRKNYEKFRDKVINIYENFDGYSTNTNVRFTQN